MKSFYVLFAFVILTLLTSCSTVQPTKPQPKIEETKPAETVIVEGGTPLETIGTVQVDSGEVIKLEVVPEQSYESGDYSVKSKLKFIQDMAKVANCLLTKKEFFLEISNHKQFDYTTDTSEMVAANLQGKTPVVVTSYCKRISKALAYRNVGSNVLYVNTCKQWGMSSGLLNTLWHERSHVVGYGHGDNSSKGKGNSVPYGTGDMAEKYFDECKKQVGVQ